MNGAPLPKGTGYALRLIAPRWYGIANVKWVKRIEVLSSRYLLMFMATDASGSARAAEGGLQRLGRATRWASRG